MGRKIIAHFLEKVNRKASLMPAEWEKVANSLDEEAGRSDSDQNHETFSSEKNIFFHFPYCILGKNMLYFYIIKIRRDKT